jgi:molybdopterin converting factor small subunit
MKIALKCFASLADPTACEFYDGIDYQLENGQTVEQLIQLAGFTGDDVASVYVNSRIANLDTVLYDGDRVALKPTPANPKKASAFQD